MLKYFFAIFIWCSVLDVQAQQGKINWLSVGEAEALYAKEAKPYLFDFYTDWCGWCKQMAKTTYANPVVISFINRYFYPVRVNAESADTFTFKEKVYVPGRNGERFVNGLALEMLGGKLSSPTTVFLYEAGKVNLVVPGYLDPLKMQGFLVYFAENVWQSAGVNEFLADFEEVFGEKSGQLLKECNYWVSFQELERKRQEQKKKILLFLEASWNNSSRMMEKVVFPDPLFAAEAQEHFYCLRLDVQSRDTLTFMARTFSNAGEQNNNLHQLAIALSDRVLRVPGIFLFDEEGKLMENLPYYMDKNRGRMILDYVGNDTYKIMSWEDYVKMRSRETL